MHKVTYMYYFLFYICYTEILCTYFLYFLYIPSLFSLYPKGTEAVALYSDPCKVIASYIPSPTDVRNKTLCLT